MSKFKVVPFKMEVADAVQIQPAAYVKNDDTEELHKTGGRGEIIIDHTIRMVEVGDVVVTYADGSKEIFKPDVFAKEFVHEHGEKVQLDDKGMIFSLPSEEPVAVPEKQAEPQSETTRSAATPETK